MRCNNTNDILKLINNEQYKSKAILDSSCCIYCFNIQVCFLKKLLVDFL